MFFQSTFLLILLGSSCYLTECLPCAYTAAIAAAEALARARQQGFSFSSLFLFAQDCLLPSFFVISFKLKKS